MLRAQLSRSKAMRRRATGEATAKCFEVRPPVQLSARGTGCAWDTRTWLGSGGFPSCSGEVLYPEDADLDGDRCGLWQRRRVELSRLPALHQVTCAQAKTRNNGVRSSVVRSV